MRNWVSVLLALPLSGCLVTRNELKESEGRRDNQEQVSTMQKSRSPERTVVVERPLPVDPNNRLAEIEASIRELNGRVDVVENRGTQDENARERGRQAVEMQLAETNKKVQLLQEEITKLDGQLQALTEHVNAMALKGVEEKKAAETSQARDAKKTPFDVAEDHFGKKEWRKAVLNYQKYRDTYPKGRRIPETIYKMGVCFQELGMKDEAKTFYDELVAKFPQSAEARRAKIRLKNLK